MLTSFFLFLILIQIKHWYIDFVNQTNEEVLSKGNYGDVAGIMHSVKHGFGTFVCICIITGLPYVIYAVILGIIDAVIHYHIDWLKMNYGNRDINSKQFWNHLGLDQMMHQITYIILAWLIFA